MECKRKFFAALLAFAICAGGVLATGRTRVPERAWAAAGKNVSPAGTFLLKGGKVYRVVKGEMKPLEGVEPQRADTDAGPWAWIVTDPEAPGMEGSEPGVLFFRGDEGKPAGFLPVEGAADFCRAAFSPSGEKLLLSWGGLPIKHLDLYFIDKDKGFVKKASFDTLGPPVWVDAHRFAFGAVDRGKGPRAEGRFDLWWSSVMLHDSATGETAAVREANATKDYDVAGYDPEAGALNVTETFVKEAQDWEDEDKIDSREIAVPIPAAR